MELTHKFELAGLGKAPYKFVGVEKLTYQACPGAPIQSGGSCDYCATGIMNAYYFRSADGKTFKVGCDCFYKANNDKSLVRKVDAAVRAHEAGKREARKVATAATLEGILTDLDTSAALAALPHPKGFGGLTAYDYAVWMRDHAGAAGKARALKTVRALLAA